METINVRDLALYIASLRNCKASKHNPKNADGELWVDVWQEKIDAMMEAMPHGSGFDRGVTLNEHETKEDKIVFDFSYTHYTEGGYRDGETDHNLIITPNLMNGFKIRITGKNKNFTKEYFYDVFNEILRYKLD